jgi:hypothetical protein
MTAAESVQATTSNADDLCYMTATEAIKRFKSRDLLLSVTLAEDLWVLDRRSR